MRKKFIKFLIVITALIPFLFISGCHPHRPVKPGPNFVWVKKHRGPNGNVIPGHWKRVGSPKHGKVWVPGHRVPDGKWVPGHWR